MSEKKTLNIDPNLFSFSNNNTTRKKRAAQPGKIKIKGESQKKKDATLKKKSILKMIRQHQEDRYKTMFEKNNAATSSKLATADESSSFKKEFQEAKEFMENLTEKKQAETSMKNFTLKNRPNPEPSSLLMTPGQLLPSSLPNVSTSPLGPSIISASSVVEPMRNIMNTPAFNNPIITNNPIQLASPKYGCLKNGSLPTYRNFMNTTQKKYPELTMVGGDNTQPQTQSQTQIKPTNVENTTEQSAIEKRINESLDRVNTMQQTADKLRELKRKSRPKINKRKRTVRRTYKIGKSKVFPRVSVLVSNKTLRNTISTKSQLLKQTPITEVKKFLIKRGFIKVGSTAPNDILRKMYESATLICGEVQNHNPDNLLYNFLNSSEM